MRDPSHQNEARRVTTVIDADACVGCGLCVDVCPKETLTLEDGKAVVSGTESLDCDHCAAVCPTGAIRVGAVDARLSQFTTFSADTRWLAPGRFDTANLKSWPARSKGHRDEHAGFRTGSFPCTAAARRPPRRVLPALARG